MPWLLLAVLLAHVLVALLSAKGIVRDDAESYVLLGRNLARGLGYVFEPGQPPTSWRAPGYPVFLAAVWSVFGESLLVARLAQALLWTATTYVCHELARLTVGPAYSLTAAGVVGFYPTFLGTTGLLWSEPVHVFVFVALCFGIYNIGLQSAAQSPLVPRRTWHWVGYGIVLGAALLTRSTTLIMIPVIVAVALARRSRGALLPAAIVLSVGLVMMGGWTLRNYRAHQRLMLIDSNAGLNLYIGNRPETPIPFAWRSQKTVHDDVDYQALTLGKDEAARDRALASAAVTHMREHPGRTLLLSVVKTIDFWLPDFFIAMNVRSGAFGPVYRPLWPLVLAATASAFLIAAAAALAQAWSNRGEPYVRYFLLVAALYTAPHAIVFGASRHHIPVTPLVLVLAAPVLHRAYAASRRRLPKVSPA